MHEAVKTRNVKSRHEFFFHVLQAVELSQLSLSLIVKYRNHFKNGSNVLQLLVHA